MVADVIFCDGCRRMVHCCSCERDRRKAKPAPPDPPHMRVGDHGETVNPRTGFRSPPPTTEWHRAPNTVCKTCYLVTGGLIGGLLTSALLWLR